MPKEGSTSVAKRVAERLAGEMGYEFIDAELHKEHGSVFLRIFVDHPNGLDLERCAAFHRQLNPLVESLDYDFLEVSSPGIDRPLKTEKDYQRHMGTRVTIKLFRSLNGAKEYEGKLRGLENGEILLETGGSIMRFQKKECAVVRPVVDVKITDSGEEGHA